MKLAKTPTTATTINSSLVLPLFNQFAQTTSNMTVTLSGLLPNTNYDLVVYSIGGTFEGGVVTGAVNGTNSGGPSLIANAGGFTNGVNYVENKFALSDSGGNLTFTIAPLPTSTYGDMDGLQIAQSAPLPTVSIQSASGGQLQVTYAGGLLLQSTNVTGSWTTNSALSPYTFTPTGAQMFFRVLGQ